jgi:uncharacterized membrane protein YhdT
MSAQSRLTGAVADLGNRPFWLCAVVLSVLWVGCVSAFVWGYLHGAGAGLPDIKPQWLLQALIALLLPPILFIAIAYAVILGLVMRKRLSSQTSDEAKPICPACGQAVDPQSIDQVFHHRMPGHLPMTEAELSASRPAARSWFH